MSAFLKTKQALRLAQTAPHEEMEPYQRAGSANKTPATALAPALDAILQRTRPLYEMTEAARNGLNAMLKITEDDRHLSFDINKIEDTIYNMGTATEATALVLSISGNAQDTAQESHQNQKNIASGKECVSSLMRGLGLLELSVNSMTQDVEKFIALTSKNNKLTTETQVNETKEYLQQRQSGKRKHVDRLIRHDNEELLPETIEMDVFSEEQFQLLSELKNKTGRK